MELFGLIGIKDIIDILIVATLLFYIYKIMKESGTLSIFLGVLAFIIVWFVASVFLKMELTGRILDKFMNIGLLILVILFQDQIKRFLVEIGSHQRWRFVHNLFRRRQTDAPRTRREAAGFLDSADCLRLSQHVEVENGCADCYKRCCAA